MTLQLQNKQIHFEIWVMRVLRIKQNKKEYDNDYIVDDFNSSIFKEQKKMKTLLFLLIIVGFYFLWEKRFWDDFLK